MKKVVLIIALLFLSVSSFAGNNVQTNNNEYAPMRYSYLTNCGVTAVSYSYEPVSLDDYNAWGAAMNDYYCG